MDASGMFKQSDKRKNSLGGLNFNKGIVYFLKDTFISTMIITTKNIYMFLELLQDSL